jgi:hypothetical protein
VFHLGVCETYKLKTKLNYNHLIFTSILTEMFIFGNIHQDILNARKADDSVNSLTSAFFAFIVVAIIVTRLISPIMARLRKLLDDISNFKFHQIHPLDLAFSDNKKDEEEKIKKMNIIFDDLINKYCKQRIQLRNYLWLLYFLIASAIGWFSFIRWDKIHSDTVIIINIFLLIILILVMQLSVPSARRITDAKFLLRKIGLNILGVSRAINPGFTISTYRYGADVSQDILYVYVTYDASIFGWRYYLECYDLENPDKRFFISYGLIKYGHKHMKLLGHDGYNSQLLVGQFKASDLPTDFDNFGISMWAFIPGYKEDSGLKPWYEMHARGSVNNLISRNITEKRYSLVDPAELLADPQIAYEFGKLRLKKVKFAGQLQPTFRLVYNLRKRLSKTLIIHSYFGNKLNLNPNKLCWPTYRYHLELMKSLLIFKKKIKTIKIK